jgi:modulator of FtsH protease
MSDAWANFFVAQCGASAALLGLIFVSVSLNLAKILAHPLLPGRAFVAMFMLLVVLLVASLMLVPGQPMAANGVEILAIGVITCGTATFDGIKSVRGATADLRGKFLRSLLLVEIATLPFLVAGTLILLGHAAGYYWLAGAILLSIVKSVTDAWVLLVEINR